MKRALLQRHRPALAEFARSNVLLAFDFDGTLAPIVRQPDRATMRAATRALLDQLVKVYPCIVISGRARKDAIARLGGARVAQVIGNHGLEPWPGAATFLKSVQRWKLLFESELKSFAGVRIEDKRYSLAVHYRIAREKKRALGVIVRVAGSLDGARIVGGKEVVNVLPLGAPNKGIALVNERARLKCDTAIYVGDDDTDEDVFSLDQPGRILGIRVGQSRASAAPYCLRDQTEVDALMQLLLELRSVSGKSSRIFPACNVLEAAK